MPKKTINNNNKVRRVSSKKRNLQADDQISDAALKKEPGQEFGIAIRSLGNSWISCQCLDKVERLCHVRGRMRKKDWVNAGDMVLLGLREHEPTKADIICKLTEGQVRELKKQGAFESNDSSSSGSGHVEETCVFDFATI